MKRSHAAQVAEDTVRVVAAGRYTNRAGDTVPIRPLFKAARTVSYPPDATLPNVGPVRRAGRREA